MEERMYETLVLRDGAFCDLAVAKDRQRCRLLSIRVQGSIIQPSF